jgi:nucleoside-diphosphate-sugar epimerase
MLSLPCPPDQIDAFLSRPTKGVLETLRRHPGDIVVAGAGGKMGGTVSLMLAAAVREIGSNARVIAVSRFGDAESRLLLESAGVEAISCDLLDRAAVSRLPDAANVIFMAGQKFGTSGAPDLTWAMNTVVPHHAAERWQGARIAAYSTGCVYALTTKESGGSNEDSPTEPPGLYAHTCLGREGIFAWHARRFGTPVALVRLNYSVEFRYGVLLDIASRVLAGAPVDVTSAHVNVIWQRDAVAHSIQCLDLAAAPAVPVNVTGPDILSVRMLAEELGARLGKPVRFSGTESPVAWLNDASRSHAAFGPPETPLSDMLDWTAAWLLQGGRTLGKPTHFESGDGKF